MPARRISEKKPSNLRSSSKERGKSGNESQSKIEYLAHEQVFSHDQKFLEEQIWNQLFLRIKLNSPVTLLENLQTDERKDGNQGLEIQPADVTAGRGA